MGVIEENVKRFHESRIMFAKLPGGYFKYIIGSKKGHKEWLEWTYNVSAEEFETVIRGYAKGGKVILYKGSDFGEVTDNEIVEVLTDDVINAFKKILKQDSLNVYSGMNVGEPGIECSPLRFIKTV